MATEHTCCVCGALMVDGACLSCRHELCGQCPVYVPEPTRDELKAQVAELEAQRREKRRNHGTDSEVPYLWGTIQGVFAHGCRSVGVPEMCGEGHTE
jgi:hypothetical protein